MLAYPQGIDIDASGNLLIADMVNNRIRKVDLNGIITTIAGNGTRGYDGDGGPTTEAWLDYPTDIAADDFGNLYIADAPDFEKSAGTVL